MKDLEKRLDNIIEEIIEIRRDFHAHPELSQHEEKTAARISRHLTDWGIPHETGIAGHGIVGLIEGKAGGSKTVAIRADIDALPIEETVDVPFRSTNPGVMHACGHDIHTAVLLGSAKLLKEMEHELCGNIKLIFQPAEETVGGALPMIKAGCLENPKVDAIIGLHVEPDIPAGAVEFRRGSMNAASNEFEITVTGVSSHGARPHQGVDAILAASQIVVALQSISSRNVSPTDPVVVTAGRFNAGTANNVLSNEAKIGGIIRTLNRETRAYAKSRVKDIAEITARAFGASAQVDINESYPALVNHDDIENILEETAAGLFDKSRIFHRPEPSMGAEDFSYFCDAVNGAYFNIGTLQPGASGQTLHSGDYCPDESCIRIGVLVEVQGALNILKWLHE